MVFTLLDLPAAFHSSSPCSRKSFWTLLPGPTFQVSCLSLDGPAQSPFLFLSTHLNSQLWGAPGLRLGPLFLLLPTLSPLGISFRLGLSACHLYADDAQWETSGLGFSLEFQTPMAACLPAISWGYQSSRHLELNIPLVNSKAVLPEVSPPR